MTDKMHELNQNRFKKLDASIQENPDRARNEIMKRPPSIVKRINEPNIELMAKAFRNLYYKSIKQEAKKKLNITQ